MEATVLHHHLIHRAAVLLSGLLLLVSSGLAQAATIKFIPTSLKSDRIIVFIHGLGGDSTTFSDWPERMHKDGTLLDEGPPLSGYAIARVLYDSTSTSPFTAKDLSG
jgi:predicted esterase